MHVSETQHVRIKLFAHCGPAQQKHANLVIKNNTSRGFYPRGFFDREGFNDRQGYVRERFCTHTMHIMSTEIIKSFIMSSIVPRNNNIGNNVEQNLVVCFLKPFFLSVTFIMEQTS